MSWLALASIVMRLVAVVLFMDMLWRRGTRVLGRLGLLVITLLSTVFLLAIGLRVTGIALAQEVGPAPETNPLEQVRFVLAGVAALLAVVLLRRIVARYESVQADLERRSDNLDERVNRRTAELATANAQLRREVEDHKATVLALHHSEERFQRAFDEGPLGLAFVDRDIRIAKANRAVCEMLGYTEQELLGQPLDLVIHPDDLDRASSLARETLADRPPKAPFELSYRNKEGRTVWGRISASIIRDEAGLPLYGLAMIEDITARRHAEAELRMSEARYRRLYESDIIGVAFGDLEGNIANANDAFLKLVGYDREDLPLQWRDMAPVEQRERDLQAVESLKERGSVTPYEREIVRKDGRRVPILIGSTLLPGSTTDSVGFFLDMTEQKQAEAALLRRQRELQLITDNMPTFIAYIDREQRYRYVNRGYAQWFGKSPDEIIGKQPSDLLDAATYHRRRPQIEGALSGTACLFDNEYSLGDGRKRWARVHFVPDAEEDGGVAGFYVLFQDVTEQRKAEESVENERQLLRRLLEIQERERRTITYDIHDGIVQYVVGAKLQVETFCAQLDPENHTGREQLELAARSLRDAVHEGRRLISGLRPPIIDDSGIVAAIEHLIDELASQDGPRIEFEHRLDDQRFAPLLESTLYRIVQEALTNAHRHSGATCATVRLSEVDNRIHLEIQDAGCGFDLNDVPSARFGIRGIQERARLFGGKATIDSAAGEGTRVEVELPVQLPPSANEIVPSP